MPDKKKWDLSKRDGLQGAAGWIRNRGKALAVLVITERDVVCSIDGKLQPLDAIKLIRDELPQLLQYLIDRRAAKVAKER